MDEWTRCVSRDALVRLFRHALLHHLSCYCIPIALMLFISRYRTNYCIISLLIALLHHLSRYCITYCVTASHIALLHHLLQLILRYRINCYAIAPIAFCINHCAITFPLAQLYRLLRHCITLHSLLRYCITHRSIASPRPCAIAVSIADAQVHLCGLVCGESVTGAVRCGAVTYSARVRCGMRCNVARCSTA